MTRRGEPGWPRGCGSGDRCDGGGGDHAEGDRREQAGIRRGRIPTDTGERFYLSLLRLYPSRFRRRYRESLLEGFRHEREEAGRGVVARLRFWSRVLIDISSSAVLRWSVGSGDFTGQRGGKERIMERMWMDCRQAIRMLHRHPAFTLLAVATMALGIGANTTMFGVVHAVLLRALPVREADRLVTLRLSRNSSSKDQLAFLRERSGALAEVGAWAGRGVTITGDGDPEAIGAARVSGNLFEVLGAAPALGHAFGAGSERPGVEPQVIIGDGLWRRRFGGETSVVGRAITVDGVDRTIIGVMSPGFSIPSSRTELWVPLVMDPADSGDWGTGYLTLVARLRDGMDRVGALADVRAAAESWREARPGVPDEFGREAKVTPLREALVGNVRTVLLLLMGAVTLVLATACVNVAGLMLTRVVTRERELAVRSALGAGRFRVARQLLTEALVLALVGGAVGTLLALAGTRLLVPLMPSDVVGASPVRLNGPVLAFAVAATLTSGLLTGVAPVAGLGRAMGALRVGSAAACSVPRHRVLLRALVVGEIASGMMLVVGATLLLRSIGHLQSVDTGYRADHVLAVGISPPGDRYGDRTALASYWTRVLAAVRAVPGIEAAGGIHILPFSGDNWNPVLRVRGREAPAEERPEVYWRLATPGFFEAMGIPLLRGRAFRDGDGPASEGIAVVNRALSERVFPGEDPIGREIRTGFEGADVWVRIVGIVGDTRDRALAEPVMPMMYRPMAQWPIPVLKVMVRTAVDPVSIAPAVRRAVWSVDPDVPITGMQRFDEVVAASLSETRLLTGLLTAFAVMALLLGGVGVFGVQAHGVSQRRSEFGIRMALGARAPALLGIVLGEAAALALLGVMVGAAGAAAVGRLLSSQLYETSPTEAGVLVLTGAILVATTLAAALAPALSAARVDPLGSMRGA